jgi:hypothetical protein
MLLQWAHYQLLSYSCGPSCLSNSCLWWRNCAGPFYEEGHLVAVSDDPELRWRNRGHRRPKGVLSICSDLDLPKRENAGLWRNEALLPRLMRHDTGDSFSQKLPSNPQSPRGSRVNEICHVSQIISQVC